MFILTTPDVLHETTAVEHVFHSRETAGPQLWNTYSTTVVYKPSPIIILQTPIDKRFIQVKLGKEKRGFLENFTMRVMSKGASKTSNYKEKIQCL